MSVKASLGQLRFRSIKEALKEAGIPYSENSLTSILVWHDTLKDIDYFKSLRPWQIVNRIPSINVLCRKAPFARVIQRISQYFPSLYSFMPKSYILPFKNSDFMRALAKKKDRYIVKPDGGSLGQGITIIEPGGEFSPDDTLAVAQKYIPSILVDNTKFDLRIYVLVASITPLEIYVYRDGLARFCSEKASGKNTIYSQITNVTLNKENPDMNQISEVSRLISDTFPLLAKEHNANIPELWRKIDKCVVLSILAAYNFLVKAERYQCPKIGYSRCFQILGFDILLDEKLDPHVLEVNYRPYLDYYRGPERRMKVGMISEAIQIAAPLAAAQSAVNARGWGWEADDWPAFISEAHGIEESRRQQKEAAVASSRFSRAFPASGELQREYERVLSVARTLPMDFLPGIKFPIQASNSSEA